MKKNEIYAEIKKFAKPCFLAKKGAKITRTLDPTDERFYYSLAEDPKRDLYQPTPLSLLGGQTYIGEGNYPGLKEELFMPVLQIDSDLPLFHALFGTGKLVHVYCPATPIRIQPPCSFLASVVETPHKDLFMFPLLQVIPQENHPFIIEWEPVEDYPDRDLWELFFPRELIDAIYEQGLAEEIAEEFPSYEQTKVGGYPVGVQHSPLLWENPEEREEWEFVLQLNEADFEVLDLVDGGIMTFFRHKKSREYQCELQFH